MAHWHNVQCTCNEIGKTPHPHTHNIAHIAHTAHVGTSDIFNCFLFVFFYSFHFSFAIKYMHSIHIHIYIYIDCMRNWREETTTTIDLTYLRCDLMMCHSATNTRGYAHRANRYSNKWIASNVFVHEYYCYRTIFICVSKRHIIGRHRIARRLPSQSLYLPLLKTRWWWKWRI